MPRRKRAFFDPKFNEWLFDALTHLNADQTKNLSHAELRMLRNPGAIKHFVVNQNLEKQLTLLTKVGMPWSLILSPPVLKDYDLITEVYKQYTFKGKAAAVAERMLKEQVFVVDDRQVALSMALTSINCHSEAYLINPNFLAFQKTMKSMKGMSSRKAISLGNFNIKHNEISGLTQDFSRLVLNVITSEDYITAVLNLRLVDMCILWLLYCSPQNFVSVNILKAELKHRYTQGTVGLRAAYLFRERNLIDKRPSVVKIPSYIIAAQGIQMVGLFNNYLVNSVYGQ